MPRIATFPLALALVALLLVSCAHKDLESDFKPIQLNWIPLSEKGENHPAKDACVISITSFLMQDRSIRESRIEMLDYDVIYDVKGENLEFEGICRDLTLMPTPECHFKAVCSDGENVVVKFHNGE